MLGHGTARALPNIHQLAPITEYYNAPSYLAFVPRRVFVLGLAFVPGLAFVTVRVFVPGRAFAPSHASVPSHHMKNWADVHDRVWYCVVMRSVHDCTATLACRVMPYDAI